MTDNGVTLKSLDRALLFKLILVVLLYSLVPLAEVFLFLYLGNLIGNYLVLIMTAVAGVAGALIALDQARRAIPRLRARLREGHYAERELGECAALIVAGIFLITPGFLTDIAGYLLLIPGIRVGVSRRLARLIQKHDKDIYERLRLSTL
jgi:UPF0716 protein FxsA